MPTSKCPSCGSPAYVGFTAVECSKRSCRHYKNAELERLFGTNDGILDKILDLISKHSCVMGPATAPQVFDERPMDQWD